MEMLVDTLGFYVFGGADVQVHFKKLNPNYVVNKVRLQFKTSWQTKNIDRIRVPYSSRL